jgi:hypothetical protein
VLAFFTVTAAPATLAPIESRTLPRIDASTVWAYATRSYPLTARMHTTQMNFRFETQVGRCMSAMRVVPKAVALIGGRLAMYRAEYIARREKPNPPRHRYPRLPLPACRFPLRKYGSNLSLAIEAISR